MKSILLKFLVWVFFIVAVFWFAGKLPGWLPDLSPFMVTLLLFLFTYVLGELLSRFLRRGEYYIYPQTVLKKGIGFVAFSLFVAACIWGAERYIGGQVNPVYFAIILYFVFRNVQLVEPKRRRKWSI